MPCGDRAQRQPENTAEESSEIESIFREFEAFTNLERGGGAATRVYRLDRMASLLNRFGNPQQHFRAVHIAGSKGKGSTAAMIDAIFTACGETVGRYTSPHISSYQERITLHGAPAPAALILPILRALRRQFAAEPTTNKPSTFEALTLTAFLCFAEAQLDRVVLETGLGGRLDATNLCRPEAVVITPIELEHTEYLGDTIAQIAAEKAGIIKRGVPVFAGALLPEAEAVVISQAAAQDAPVHLLASYLHHLDRTVHTDGDELEITLLQPLSTLRTRLQMRGRAQASNAVLAALTARALLPTAQAACIEAGLAAAVLPARSELFQSTPPVMLDGAHTPNSVAAVCETFFELFSGEATLLFGAASDKDIAALLSRALPFFEQVILSRPGTFRHSDPERMLQICTELGKPARYIEHPEQALSAAMAHGNPVLVVGSFYLAGEFRPLLCRLSPQEAPLNRSSRECP